MQRASSAAEHEPSHCGIDSMSSLADQPKPHADPDKVAARVEQLYASHSELVRTVCRSVLRSRAEAEDAVQQTFLSAQRGLLNGASPRDFAAWLVAIARHESFARVHALMREPLPIETEAEPIGQDAYATAVSRHEVSELRAAISELPAQQREALLLREMRGLSYEEVASTLSVTTSAVESLLFRARRNLQMRLREALAAFSPAGLMRELATRLGGGFAAPAAAKALALGLGTAVVTGGAVVDPQMIGLGHAPLARSPARAAAIPHVFAGGATADMPSRSAAQLEVPTITGRAPDRHDTTRRLSHDAVPSRSESADSLSHAGSGGGGDRSGSSDSGSSDSKGATGTGSGDSQTTSSAGDGTTTDSSSQSSEPQPTTETTATSTNSDSSGGSGNTDGSTTTTASGGD